MIERLDQCQAIKKFYFAFNLYLHVISYSLLCKNFCLTFNLMCEETNLKVAQRILRDQNLFSYTYTFIYLDNEIKYYLKRKSKFITKQYSKSVR